MALTDILRDRAARRGGTAQVDCGELGCLTVEALSPADCARLSDSRSLLYAACRELQMTGEALRSEGRLFRPDEIMSFVTDDEADAAARTILELSQAVGANDPLSGIRLSPVQPFSEAIPEIRHQSVQSEAAHTGLPAAGAEIRLSSVQGAEATLTKNGQVSREFAAETDDAAAKMGADKKAQILGEMSSRTAQILVSENGKEHQNGFSAAGVNSDLHEIKSEVREMLHEIESELPEAAAQRLAEGLLRAIGVR